MALRIVLIGVEILVEASLRFRRYSWLASSPITCHRPSSHGMVVLVIFSRIRTARLAGMSIVSSCTDSSPALVERSL